MDTHLHSSIEPHVLLHVALFLWFGTACNEAVTGRQNGTVTAANGENIEQPVSGAQSLPDDTPINVEAERRSETTRDVYSANPPSESAQPAEQMRAEPQAPAAGGNIDETETMASGAEEAHEVGSDATSESTSTNGIESDEAGQEAAESVPATSRIEYHLNFTSEGIEIMDDSTWRTVNERGDEIHLTGGFVVSYLASLVPCRMWDGETGFRWPSKILNALGIGTAVAGHPGDLDPSGVIEPVVESLTGFSETRFTPVFVDQFRYCKAHYLVGRADEETRITSRYSHREVDGLSLMVTGRWRRHDEMDWQEFSIETSYSYGNLKALYPPEQFNLAEAAFQLDTGTHSAVVTITRHLESLFRNVDLGEENERALQLSLLRGLVRTSTIEVEAIPLE